jgi:hypothetical protein
MYGDGGCMGPSGAKVVLFGGFVIAFAAVIASIWIMADGYIINEGVKEKYPGYAIMIQNIFILASSMLFKFARGNSDDYSSNFF